MEVMLRYFWKKFLINNKVLIVALWLMGAGLCACDSGSDKETAGTDAGKNSSATSTAPAGDLSADRPNRYGGQIIMASIGEPSGLISVLTTDAPSHDVAAYFYVGCLRYNKDLEIEPWAAESYEVLDDGRLLRFTLRKGILWEDGVELTAADVEFTYKLMIDKATPTAYAEDFLAVKDFRVTGKYSFEVEYEKPFARALMTWMQDILPAHLLAGVHGADLLASPLNRKPLSAGPYVLKEWEAGSRLVFEANPRYFEGSPYIRRVVYRVIPDMATSFLELKAGNLDMLGLSPQQYTRQTSGGAWDTDWAKYKYLSFGYTYLGYNLKHPFFADRRVRVALAHAIDKESIVKGVLLGEGMPTIGPYKPGTWVYNDKIKDYPFSPDTAKAMLAEAGFADSDNDGILDKDGKPFEFTILTNQGNEQRIKTATIIQQQLAVIGIKVQIRTVEWAAFIKEFVHTGNFDALILGWNILQDPDLYDVWHSSKVGNGGLNFTGFSNPEVDKLLDEARSTLDQAERKVLYDRFQEILHAEQPYCFLYVPQALTIVNKRIRGIKPAPAGLTYNFNKWWDAAATGERPQVTE